MLNTTLQVSVKIDTENHVSRKYFIDIPLNDEIFLENLNLVLNKTNYKAYYYDEHGEEIYIQRNVINTFNIFSIKRDKRNKRNDDFCIFEQIAGITSRETAITLAENYGGIRTYIPKKAKIGNALVKLIGIDNLEKIICAIGCGYVVIPSKGFRGAGRKAQRIIALLEQEEKWTVKQIALEIECCERTVWLHKKKWSRAKAILLKDEK